jgi:hypothetical protein
MTPAFTFYLPFSFPGSASILPVFPGKWRSSLIKGDITVWASYTDCCSERLKAKTGRKSRKEMLVKLENTSGKKKPDREIRYLSSLVDIKSPKLSESINARREGAQIYFMHWRRILCTLPFPLDF